MTATSSSKTLALLVEDNVITYLTRSNQDEELFFSEPVRFEFYENSSYEQLLNNIKSQLPLLLYYNQIKIFYTTPDVKIIPNAYLSQSNDKNLEENLKLEHQIVRLKNIDAKLCFKVNPNLQDALYSLPNYKEATYHHIGEHLINQSDINKELSQVFVRIINQNLELCIYKNGEFYLYNIVEQNADEDVVFYIMNTIQQLGINPASVEVIFDYGITDTHKALEYLPKFVKQVHVNTAAEGKDFKYILYNLFECE